MEEVGEEGRELQKLEGMLSELGDVNRELATGKLSYSDANDAYIRANGLAAQVQKAKESVMSKAASLGGLLRKGRYEQQSTGGKNSTQDEMDKDVLKQQELLTKNWGNYEGKEAKPTADGEPGIKPETQWTPNVINEPIFSQRNSNTFSGSVTTNGGNAVMNDNIALSNGFFENGRSGNLTAGRTTSATGSLTLNSGSVHSNAIVGGNSYNVGNARANSLSNAVPDLKVRSESMRSDGGFVDLHKPIRLPEPGAGGGFGSAISNPDSPMDEDPFARSPVAGRPFMAKPNLKNAVSASADSSISLPMSPPPILGDLAAAPAPAAPMNADPFGSAAPKAQELTIHQSASTSLESIAASPLAASTAPSPIALNYSGALHGLPASLPGKADRRREGDQERNRADAGQLTQAQSAEFLRPTGRRSLMIQVPTEGVVRHFTKLKDHAVLSIELQQPWQSSTKSNLLYLSLAIAAWGFSMRLKRRTV